MEATTHALHGDFERGATDRRKCRRHNRPILALGATAFAVGSLLGYQVERRRQAIRRP